MMHNECRAATVIIGMILFFGTIAMVMFGNRPTSFENKNLIKHEPFQYGIWNSDNGKRYACQGSLILGEIKWEQ